MRIGTYRIKLQRRTSLPGWEAALIAVLAVVVALLLFSLIFVLAGVSPLTAYRGIFEYAFANKYGTALTLNRFIFLALATFAFIVPYRAGLWNIGMTGQLYLGALGAYGAVYLLGGKTSPKVFINPYLGIPLMILGAMIAGALLGAIPGLLKGKMDVNEIVVTMMLNFVAFWLVSQMIKEGGLFMNPQGRGESFELPQSLYAPVLLNTKIPFTLFFALGLAVGLDFLFAKTKLGYQIRAYGRNPSAARYAGIDPSRVALLVFVLGGAIAGLAGYHYFAAVPGVYKIARNYSYFGDLAFYGIICGLISQGNAIAALPVALLFGGLSIGGRYMQGKLHMKFGVDYALLGVLMITLVAFQFFYRYEITLIKEEERLHVAVHSEEF